MAGQRHHRSRGWKLFLAAARAFLTRLWPWTYHFHPIHQTKRAPFEQTCKSWQWNNCRLSCGKEVCQFLGEKLLLLTDCCLTHRGSILSSSQVKTGTGMTKFWRQVITLASCLRSPCHLWIDSMNSSNCCAKISMLSWCCWMGRWWISGHWGFVFQHKCLVLARRPWARTFWARSTQKISRIMPAKWFQRDPKTNRRIGWLNGNAPKERGSSMLMSTSVAQSRVCSMKSAQPETLQLRHVLESHCCVSLRWFLPLRPKDQTEPFLCTSMNLGN